MKIQVTSRGNEPLSEKSSTVISKLSTGTHQELRGITIADVDIASGEFLSADMEEFDFFRVFFEKCTFSMVNLSSFTMSGGGFRKCTFVNADFVKASIVNAVVEDVVFENCSFNRAEIFGGRFINVNFNGSNLSYAAFTDCDVRGVDFANSILIGTCFSNCLADEDLALTPGVIVR